MGAFSVEPIIWNPSDPSRSQEVEVLVDTGASYTWISRSRLSGLGVQPTRRMTFRTVESRMIERDIAVVFVKVDGYVGGDNVVMAQDGDLEVLGAFTLEALGLAADPVKKVLVPTIGLAS